MSANITRDVAETSGFIPETWANKALDILRANIALAKIIARDVDFEPQPQGKTLNIPYPGTFTAQKKSPNTPATTQVPVGGTSIPVTLSELAYVDFIVEDFARVQANDELLTRWVEPAAVAIAEQFESDLWTLYSEMTGGSVGAAGTNLSAASIREAKGKLDQLKIPQTNRALVVSAKDQIALLADEELARYFANSRPEMIEAGALGPPIYGFTPYMSQLAPVVDGGEDPDATQNLALHKNAMIAAIRPLSQPDAGTGVMSAAIVDEASGLAIRVLKSYDVAERGHRIGFDMLYGFRELRTNHGVNLVS
jgi:hypothetical protein